MRTIQMGDDDLMVMHAITDEITQDVLPVTVKLYGSGVGITIQGYGNKTVVGDAEIVYLDYFDRNREDPVLIDLAQAAGVFENE